MLKKNVKLQTEGFPSHRLPLKSDAEKSVCFRESKTEREQEGTEGERKRNPKQAEHRA